MLPFALVRNLGRFSRLGFSADVLRSLAATVAVLTALLATGVFSFADAGCGHGEPHDSLSHEHRAEEHAGADERAQPHGENPRGENGEHPDDDACPPFCGDCDDCAGCFHPIATAIPALALVTVPAMLERPDHLRRLPARPAHWSPSPPLHVPRARA